MLYRRVEIVDGETVEPVQFVGVYAMRWPEDLEATVAFVEDEDATDCLAAYDAMRTILLKIREEFVQYPGLWTMAIAGEIDDLLKPNG